MVFTLVIVEQSKGIFLKFDYTVFYFMSGGNIILIVLVSFRVHASG